MWRLLISHSSPTLFSIDHVALQSSPSSRMPHLNISPSIIRMYPPSSSFNRSPDPEMKLRGNEWGHVIPKADSKFWTGDHSIRKSYIKGVQCSFRFWTYNILPPILSSLHISFMCSQSISTLIQKGINIQQRPINIVRFVRTPRFVLEMVSNFTFDKINSTWDV